MTSHDRPTLRARHAGAAALLVCLLFLACIPAAIARSSHERSTSESSAPTPVSEPAKPAGESHAERKAAAQESAPAPAAKPEHSKHAGATAPAAGGEASSSETTTTTTTAPGARHSGQPHAQSGHGGQDAGRRGDRGQQGAGAATGDAGRHSSSADTQAKANARTGSGADSSAEGRRAQERAEKPRGASHVAKGKAKTIEAARPATLPSETTSTATTSTASSAGAPAAGVTTIVAAPLAAKASLATSAAPSIVRHAPQRSTARNRPSARANGHGGGSATATAAAVAGTPLAVTAPVAPASTGTPSAHAKKVAEKHGAPVTRSSPLVNTITRFVGVVPTPIWIAIGVLAALALAMTGRSRFSVLRAQRLERQRGELLEDVGLLQTALLPDTPARLGPVGTSAAYRPAAGPAAGGDFYDVFALEDGQLGVIVGDVSGHGRKALPHTALLRFTLRAYLEAGLSPRGAVQTAGAVLERQLGGSFATVVAATYNPRERRLVYASAGHPPPIVRGAQPGAQALEPITVSSSLPIGVGLTGTRQSVVSVPGAAEICFFTDGVTEARVGSELYGVQRLEEALAQLGSQATADELLDSVALTADRRPDDMAACLLHIEGSAQAPCAEAEELELGREEASSPRTEHFLLACGVAAEQAAEVMRSARVEAERSGSVLLQIRHHHEEGPEVSLGHDNIAYLQTRHAARQADLRVSR